MTEVGAPIVAALSKADDATQARIKKEVFAKVGEKYPDHVAIDASANIISATK